MNPEIDKMQPGDRPRYICILYSEWEQHQEKDFVIYYKVINLFSFIRNNYNTFGYTYSLH